MFTSIIHQEFEWDLTNGPRSVSCDRAIRYSGLGVRETWVLWVRLLGLHNFLSNLPGLLRRRGGPKRVEFWNPAVWRTVRSLSTQPLMCCLLMFFSVMVFRPDLCYSWLMVASKSYVIPIYSLWFTLEVQLPVFIFWFMNHHFFSKGLSSSRRKSIMSVLKWW